MLSHPLPTARALLALLASLALCSVACSELPKDGPELAKQRRHRMSPGDRIPDVPEANASGPLERRIARGTPEFRALVKCSSPLVVFKNEEKSGADRLMTPRLSKGLARLGERVDEKWPGVRLRVTEAWDEDIEHAPKSLHYEGRAADITTSDLDPYKLADLAKLASEVPELDWIFYENEAHVHVSVRR